MTVCDEVDINIIVNTIRQIKENYPIYICGYGINGEELERWFSQRNIDYNGFIDKKIRKTKTGKPCTSYEEFRTESQNCFVIISSGSIHYIDMYNQLIECGVSDDRIMRLMPNALYSMIVDSNRREGLDRTKECGVQLKGIHKGRRAFIVGNGPSLRLEDLDRIKNEISFATNEIYDAYEHTAWRPTYYTIEDRMGAYENVLKEDRLEYIVKNSSNVLCSELTKVYEQCSELKYDNVYFYKPLMYKAVPQEQLLPFAETVEDGVVLGEGTSIYSMYQFAAYMGFEEIYLLGMDCNYPKELDEQGNILDKYEGKAHAEFIQEVETKTVVANTYRMIRDHLSAREFCEKHNIKVYNATRGGMLDVFERVDFDKLMKL